MNLIPMGLCALVVIYGAASQIMRPWEVVYSVFGVPFYGLYPWSMIVFGGFGFLLCAFKDRYNGLIVAMAAGTMFDLIGTATAYKHPDFFSFMFWMAPIFCAFILAKKNILTFVWSRPFLGYVVFDFFLVGPLSHLLAPILAAEIFAEGIWCVFFYFAFYKTDFANPMKALAHIT